MYTHKKKILLYSVAAILLVLGGSRIVWSHCEIPCGIYNDPMRLDMIAEHIQTIEKSMNQINQLSAAENKDNNQLVRWIMNKENHADYLSDIVTQYFMKQRINPVEDKQNEAYGKYIRELTLLHQMMFYSMKCKQATDLKNVAQLKRCLGEFRTSYLGSGEHVH